LGILGIENRKPKIVNCKFFLSFQASNNYHIFYFFKIIIFLFFIFRVRADSRGEGGRGGRGGEGREGREGMERGGDGREGGERGGEGDASARMPMSARSLGCVRADMGVRADAP
jgi:hypothetical protein